MEFFINRIMVDLDFLWQFADTAFSHVQYKGSVLELKGLLELKTDTFVRSFRSQTIFVEQNGNIIAFLCIFIS